MQIRSSKNSCMGKENRLYSISLGVASLQGGLVGVATALSPATCRPFQVFSPSFFVGLGLRLIYFSELTTGEILVNSYLRARLISSIYIYMTVADSAENGGRRIFCLSIALRNSSVWN